MAHIVCIHSFRGGTGKSNIAANLAGLLAGQGARVGVVDTDIQSPGIHVLFGIEESEVAHSLNDYLWGACTIEDAALDVTDRTGTALAGRIFLIPSSIKSGDISRIIREGYDVGLLNDGYQSLIETLGLDVLLVDTHPGLNEETLLSIAIADTLGLVMRPDQQDYQGTSVTVEVARKLGVPGLLLIVNKVPVQLDARALRSRIEQTYDCEVGAILHHSDEMMRLGSAGIFSLRYPEDPVTAALKELAARIAKG